jgi:hypothetical protein
MVDLAEINSIEVLGVVCRPSHDRKWKRGIPGATQGQIFGVLLSPNLYRASDELA